MHLSLETGITGGDPGTREDSGNRRLARMFGPGGRPAVPGNQVTGRPGAVRPGEVPSISYMEGTFVIYGCPFSGLAGTRGIRCGENEACAKLPASCGPPCWRRC